MNLLDFIIDDVDKVNNYLSTLTSAAKYYPG